MATHCLVNFLRRIQIHHRRYCTPRRHFHAIQRLHAAKLFAQSGYPSAKMQDIAKACGTSKSALYHYFPAKDDLLFAMLEEHLQEAISLVEKADVEAKTDGEQFARFVQRWIQKSAKARRRNMVAMNDVKYLPKSLQKRIVVLEIAATDAIAARLRRLNSTLPKHLYKPYTMLLLGMLNYTDTWFNASGKVKPAELAERISRLFLARFVTER